MARTVKGTFPQIRPATPEWDAFTEALADAVTPCRGLDAWTSEDAAERAVAARACEGCEVLTLCAAAAESTGERYGVYAGVDRSPRVGAPPKTTERKTA